MRHHPYSSLPPNAFWKTAVAEVDPLEINLAWSPKSQIDRRTKIVTAGSCFAQHISRSLKENGFLWLDSEPAPSDLPATAHSEHGYGVFSFRTGNIYTAALLKQWIWWALGKSTQSSEAFEAGNRFYDPFRPTIVPDGFASPSAVLTARTHTLKMIEQAIRSADLFIFTLGLTEGWRNTDGTVYAMCPGTARGTFSPEDHHFHNYSESEIESDLADIFDTLNAVNPYLRFLLTVSPVPLTATASGQHVMTATTYSKSVLRSAAGHLAATREDTDYFPSYELITAPAFKGVWFEKNQRSISKEGVTFVMGHFMASIEGTKQVGEDAVLIEQVLQQIKEPGTQKTEKDICDDIILESWANRREDASDEPAKILLVGDSHVGMIAKALTHKSIPFAGGAIMNRSDWHAARFYLEEKSIFRPHNLEQQGIWDDVYDKHACSLASPGAKNWLLTNIGMHTTEAIGDRGLFAYMTLVHGNRKGTITSEELHAYLLHARQKHIAILSKFRSLGYNVLVITDPPTEPYFTELFIATDQFLCDFYQTLGCKTFSARNWIASMGRMPETFRSTEINPATGQIDWIHGSAEYYDRLVDEIFRRFSIGC